MRILKIAKYQIYDSKKALLIYYGIIILLTAVFTFESINIQRHPGSQVSMGGMDMVSAIFIFIAGLNSFKANYKFMQANGVSRKKFFIGHIVSIFPIAALMAALDIIINRVSSLAAVNNSMFSQIYYVPNEFEQVNPNIIVNFAWSFAVLALFAILGWFISIIYYRCNKLLKTVVSISPVILIIIMIYIDNMLNGRINTGIWNFFVFTLGLKNGLNPYIAVISMLIEFSILALLSFLLIRRAPVKD